MEHEIATETWLAYESARDRGHIPYVKLANRCEKFFRGEQWSDTDLNKLGDRPALTVNMVLATMATAFGQMIENFAEVTFFAKDGRYDEKAKVLQMLVKHVYQSNKMKWAELDMAMDGFITGRGFLDVRMDFGENLRGDIDIQHLNPRDVLLDAEAKTYTPEGWKEVFITRWLTADEIATLYGESKAKKLRNRPFHSFHASYDRLTSEDIPGVIGGEDARNSAWIPSAGHEDSIPIRFRVIERQVKRLSSRTFFLDEDTGETRPVPENWEDDKIEKVLLTAIQNNVNITLIKRKTERFRLIVVAADIVLHDDWSPYDCFTVVPYFPWFRWGKTMGVVENLLDLQEGINKVFSQTLHIINTTANSGWKVKAGSLVNMTVEELEDKGAQSGLVVELNNINDLEKITPNAIPQGLDRISNQMAEWVKYVSGISDSMRGFDRSDVAAKAIVAKQQAGAVSLAVPFESLNRTRTYLAEVILKMIQRFYTEPRVFRVAPTRPNGEEQTVEINTPTSSGLLNDVTVGEYGVQISTVPPGDKHEESQFQRAIELKQSGIPIPDWAIVEVSGLPNKMDIIEALKATQEAQQPIQELEMQKAQADVSAILAGAKNKEAQADVLEARVQEILTRIQGMDPKDAQAKALAELQSGLKQEKMQRDDEFRYRKLALDALGKENNNGRTTTSSNGGDPSSGDTPVGDTSTGS